MTSMADFPENENHRARRAKSKARWDVIARDGAPLAAALREAGFEVDSAWDLFSRDDPTDKRKGFPNYSPVIPLLLDHLSRRYHPRNREGIVRALTDRMAKAAAPILAELWIETKERGSSEAQRAREMMLKDSVVVEKWSEAELLSVERANWDSFRDALANAVGFHMTRDQIPDVLEWIQDRSLDSSRVMLIEWLGVKARRWKLTEPEIESTLMLLLKDPAVSPAALSALKKVKRD